MHVSILCLAFMSVSYAAVEAKRSRDFFEYQEIPRDTKKIRDIVFFHFFHIDKR
jgi:hypothetical protein